MSNLTMGDSMTVNEIRALEKFELFENDSIQLANVGKWQLYGQGTDREPAFYTVV